MHHAINRGAVYVSGNRYLKPSMPAVDTGASQQPHIKAKMLGKMAIQYFVGGVERFGVEGLDFERLDFEGLAADFERLASCAEGFGAGNPPQLFRVRQTVQTTNAGIIAAQRANVWNICNIGF